MAFSITEYTLEKAIDHVGFGKYQIKVMLVSILAWVSSVSNFDL